NVFAKTDKYYIKKFRAETNLSGYLVMDLSASMNYTFRQELTKFEYSICLAAALGYLMIHQQDPVGLVTFDTAIRGFLPPKSRRSQLATILGILSGLKPTGTTNLPACIHQLATMIRTKSLVILFTDLLRSDPQQVIHSLHHLRHRGNEVILFHVMDEAEVKFPFKDLIIFEEPESSLRETYDADSIRTEYLAELERFRNQYKTECFKANIDYVPVDTSMGFDKALTEYLINRQRRF
ncbi:MAG TPA: VWA domain-containing protein, partial [Gemmatales bacterium]|nr:VWA domain-containing protein [Gemmatales bacterium]